MDFDEFEANNGKPYTRQTCDPNAHLGATEKQIGPSTKIDEYYRQEAMREVLEGTREALTLYDGPRWWERLQAWQGD